MRRHLRGNLIYFLKYIVCRMGDKTTHETTHVLQVFRKTIPRRVSKRLRKRKDQVTKSITPR